MSALSFVRREKISRLAMVMVAGVAMSVSLTGCMTNRNSQDFDPMTTSSTGEAGQASFTATQKTREKWQKDTGDVRAGMAYIQQLDLLDQKREVVAVLAELVNKNPQNAQVAAVYGKKLGAIGQAEEAERWLRKSISLGDRDWKTYSALGSMLDQQGRNAQAREQYQKALAVKPDEIKVYNNIGMSYALEGNLQQAEQTLRKASLMRTGQTEPRVRQNLALVVALQGRFSESREIASRDMPPDVVNRNMSYIKKMMEQKDTWQKLQKQG